MNNQSDIYNDDIMKTIKETPLYTLFQYYKDFISDSICSICYGSERCDKFHIDSMSEDCGVGHVFSSEFDAVEDTKLYKAIRRHFNSHRIRKQKMYFK